MLSTVKQCAVMSAMLLWLIPSVHSGKKVFKCHSSCSCFKESIICVGSSYVPRITPNDVSSLSIVNGTFSEVKEAMFAHMPSLQLLLLNSNALTTIRDDAFAGLPHLEYLFIENNKIETTSKYSFRGLRDLTHLSLANNNIKALPRDLFADLDSLIELNIAMDGSFRTLILSEMYENEGPLLKFKEPPDNVKGL